MRDFYTRENMQGDLFHVADGGLVFAPASLSFEAEAGTGREGAIRVRHRDGRPARGYVYPSEPCMRGVREQFGASADGTGTIRWRFDAHGIAPGRTVRGFFAVVSPYGEYRVPYEVLVTGKGELARKKSAGAPGGEAAEEAGIRSMEDFCRLAREDFAGAVDFFYGKSMEAILESEEDRTLYRGLSMRPGDAFGVEEFLVSACGQEKTVFVPAEKSLFLQTRAKAGRPEGRLAGSRAEQALQAHRRRVRSSGLAQERAAGRGPGRAGSAWPDAGMGHAAAPLEEELGRRQALFGGVGPASMQDAGPDGLAARDTGKEDLAYIPLTIRKMGGGHIRPVLRAEGRFFPAALLDVPFPEADGASSRSVTVQIPVDRGALHAGRNLGRVVLQGPFQEAEVPVEIYCKSSAAALHKKQDRERRRLLLRLMQLYVDIRLQEMETAEAGRLGTAPGTGGQLPGIEKGQEPEPGAWPSGPAGMGEAALRRAGLQAAFRQAEGLIDEIALRSHRDLISRLYGVHLLLLRGQDAEAERELGRIAARQAGPDAMQHFGAHFPGEREDAYCYRQYLYARIRKGDVRLRAHIVRFLHGAYRRESDWRLAWMLMDLADEYAPGTAARWNFLRRQFEGGCKSPVIFLEAWEMVRRDPRILLPEGSVQERWARDDFALHVLWYAARCHALTPRATRAMVSLAEKKKGFSGLLYKGLCAAYGMWDAGDARDVAAQGEPVADVERAVAGFADAPGLAAQGEPGPAAGPMARETKEAGAGEEGEARREPGGHGAGRGLAEDLRREVLGAICRLLMRAQDLTPRAHLWYGRALDAGIALTRLEENYARSAPREDAACRLPSGYNAVLRTTAGRAVRAVLIYDRFRGEQVFPIRGGVAFLPVYGGANTIFLEDALGNRYAKSLPYVLDLATEAGRDGTGGSQTRDARDGEMPEDIYALAQWLGLGERGAIRLRRLPGTEGPMDGSGGADGPPGSPARASGRAKASAGPAPGSFAAPLPATERIRRHTFAAASARLLDSGQMMPGARADFLMQCLRAVPAGAGDARDWMRFFLSRADPARCDAGQRERLLEYLAEAGCHEDAVRWLLAFGSADVAPSLVWRICGGLSWEGNPALPALAGPLCWDAFLRGSREPGLLDRLSIHFQGLSEDLLRLRAARAEAALSTTDLDGRIVRQCLYSGAMSQMHAPAILGGGKKLGDVFLPALAQYADFAFETGLPLGPRMTELIVGLLAGERGGAEEPADPDPEAQRPQGAAGRGTGPFPPAEAGRTPGQAAQVPDIIRIACLKELSIRQEDLSGREREAAKESLGILLSKGILFPFYRQFPGLDDRLDLYAEETFVQYHPAREEARPGQKIVFHYTTSRRGEAGSYRAHPMKEMYRDFYVAGFLLFYGEQMHYYITDDAVGEHVVQSGMIGQDARIADGCSGRFGSINDATRAAALRDHDRALALLSDYYRKTYLEEELFRRSE